jgi:hypothetical protein
MTSYTEVISLEQAKNYLRIDDGMTADDSFITSMIKASLQWIEQYTRHILVEQEVTLYAPAQTNCEGQYIYYVYHYPIVSALPDADKTTRNLYSKYYTTEEELVITAGYDELDLVPEAIIQASYGIMQAWYYNSEKQIQSSLIPDSVKFALDPYRRFPLF